MAISSASSIPWARVAAIKAPGNRPECPARDGWRHAPRPGSRWRKGCLDHSRSARQSIVPTFAVRPADGMDRREVDNVKTHFADARQLRDDISQCAMGSRPAQRIWETIHTSSRTRRVCAQRRRFDRNWSVKNALRSDARIASCVSGASKIAICSSSGSLGRPLQMVFTAARAAFCLPFAACNSIASPSRASR